MEKKALFIFDMDGLLLDTERLYRLCWIQTFNDLEIDIDPSEINQIIGIGFQDLKERLTLLFHGEDEFNRLRDHREKLFWQVIEEKGLPIKPGALDLLQELRNAGQLTAIASSTMENRAKKLMKWAGLDHKFDFEVFGDHVPKTKPSPDIFNRVLELSGIAKEKCVVFEDSYNGVLAANAAGIDVIWILDLIDLRDKTGITYAYAYDSLEEAISTIKQLL